MRLDLHLHSTASDGTVGPEEVVQAAARGRLDVISLSDHDTTAGVAPARAAAMRIAESGGRPVEVIPAIEVSSTWMGEELHFLGYFVDPEAPALLNHADRAGRRRLDRMEEMLSRLAAQGVHITLESVLDAAGPARETVARPHLARALVNAGHVGSVPEAFDRYIGNAHDAFVPTLVLDPEGAVRLILQAGGIPIWAHPPDPWLENLLDGLLEVGLRGLEVYRPRTPARRVLALERMVRERGLLASGGSDWHGPDSGDLGDFHVTGEEVQRLLEAGGL
jgi:predicted metal-dependent phosphoesterase TrpH